MYRRCLPLVLYNLGLANALALHPAVQLLDETANTYVLHTAAFLGMQQDADPSSSNNTYVQAPCTQGFSCVALMPWLFYTSKPDATTATNASESFTAGTTAATLLPIL